MKKLFIISALLTVFCFMSQAQQVVFDFNDGTWGEAVTVRPEAGDFASSTINDVKLNNAELFQKDGKGLKRVILDKKSTKSSIEFPTFQGSKKEVLIDAATGSDDKTMVVEQKIGNKWEAIGQPTVLNKKKDSYSYVLSDKATQVRIINPTTSALYVYKVTIQ